MAGGGEEPERKWGLGVSRTGTGASSTSNRLEGPGPRMPSEYFLPYKRTRLRGAEGPKTQPSITVTDGLKSTHPPRLPEAEVPGLGITETVFFSRGSHQVERSMAFSSPHHGVCSSTDTSVLQKGGVIWQKRHFACCVQEPHWTRYCELCSHQLEQKQKTDPCCL